MKTDREHYWLNPNCELFVAKLDDQFGARPIEYFSPGSFNSYTELTDNATNTKTLIFSRDKNQPSKKFAKSEVTVFASHPLSLLVEPPLPPRIKNWQEELFLITTEANPVLMQKGKDNLRDQTDRKFLPRQGQDGMLTNQELKSLGYVGFIVAKDGREEIIAIDHVTGITQYPATRKITIWYNDKDGQKKHLSITVSKRSEKITGITNKKSSTLEN